MTAPDLGVPLIAALAAEIDAWRSRALAADAALAAELSAAHPAAQLLALLERRRPVWRGFTLEAGWDRMPGMLNALRDKQEDIKYKPTLLEAYRRDLHEDPAWYDRLDGANAQLSE